MTSNYKSIDTNILIEVLCRPESKKSISCQKLILTKKLKLSHIVIGETIYVATKIYKLSKEKTAQFLKVLINRQNILTSNSLVLATTLNLFSTHNLDWADCYLVGQFIHNQSSGIYSYDTDLDKVNKIVRYEP